MEDDISAKLQIPCFNVSHPHALLPVKQAQLFTIQGQRRDMGREQGCVECIKLLQRSLFVHPFVKVTHPELSACLIYFRYPNRFVCCASVSS